ncbi:hypothetical protein MPTK1_4g06890 [Marchantia polymorpha subsp. ruderalis]|uniref:Uncharacterized protein n=2 Tax=Marchantia polymorpha TaxID=3197 RepID=A0AAF6B785_MARPO|nr:hypothetical protein MARPO_0125s0034 [Marchantia polymorpha]BBN07869.1 hypothetical protein Mp_4g06890 [Marchantia polymorpha subsp. ruderalis]|eukprot:PTQ30403.1 hypothetical protein MARPO_0125s0034 [Marchantia polymorpha]
MSIVHVLVQPSVYFHEKHLAACGGIKAFLACPQDTRLQAHEHGGRSSESFNTLSVRCAVRIHNLAFVCPHEMELNDTYPSDQT